MTEKRTTDAPHPGWECARCAWIMAGLTKPSAYQHPVCTGTPGHDWKLRTETPTRTEAAAGVCEKCVCACDCCIDRVRGRLVPRRPTDQDPATSTCKPHGFVGLPGHCFRCGEVDRQGIELRDLRSAVEAFRNSRDHYKDCWEQSCRAVEQLCKEAGMPDGGMPDLWTLRECIQRLTERARQVEQRRERAPSGGPHNYVHKDFHKAVVDKTRTDTIADVVEWIRGFANEKHPIEAGEVLLSPASRGVLLMVADHFEKPADCASTGNGGEHAEEAKEAPQANTGRGSFSAGGTRCKGAGREAAPDLPAATGSDPAGRAESIEDAYDRLTAEVPGCRDLPESQNVGTSTQVPTPSSCAGEKEGGSP